MADSWEISGDAVGIHMFLDIKIITKLSTNYNYNPEEDCTPSPIN